MRWPPWSSESTNDEQKQTPSSWLSSAANNPRSILDWTAFTEVRTLVPTLVLTSGILIAVRFHRRYLRRIPDAPSISSSYLRRRSIFGQVTSVGDGDNFRIFHTPGGRMAGWGWLPWKKVPTAKKDLKDKTVGHPPLTYSLPIQNRHNGIIMPLHIIPQAHSISINSLHIHSTPDPHPPRWRRRPRTSPLRPPRTTFRARGTRLANILPVRPTSSCPRLPPRSILARGSECFRPARI